jgi:hypothetical protein
MATLEQLLGSLPPVGGRLATALRRVVDARPIGYPLGSGQAEEVAVRTGLKPLLRQMLSAEDAARARPRLERRGWAVEEAAGADGAVLVFAGPDPARVREAARLETACAREAGAQPHRAMGELLGYPPCCTEAFAGCGGGREPIELVAAALRATRGRPAARLNVLDLAVFHYVSWYPCAFDCALSTQYANAVAQGLRRRFPAFVRAVDAALGAHRLVLAPSVQLSVEGQWDGRELGVRRLWPTARDRHPQAPSEPAAREATVRALALLRGAREVRVEAGAPWIDGVRASGFGGVLLLAFGEGPRAPSRADG